MSCKFFSHFSRGFTLIELSVSVLIISLLLGGIISIENQKIRVSQQQELTRKLDAIGAALYHYRLLNNKLPCPGNSALARESSSFGVQANAVVDEACDAGVTISSNLNTSAGEVFGGSVPVRTLGLPDDVAYDPWGREFTYYIAQKANGSSHFTGEYGTAGVADDGKLEVEDESGTAVVDNVLAVVLSHGSNGHGGYNIAGVRVNAGSTNAAELVNCMCTSAAVASPAPASLTVRIQRTLPTSSTDFRTNFDDVGRFFNQGFFAIYSEKSG